MKLIDKIAAHFGYVPFSDLKDIAEDIGKFDEIAQEAAHRLKSTAALEDFANYVGLVNVSKVTTDHYIMFESGWDMDVATPAFASMGLIFMESEPEVIEEDITEKVNSSAPKPQPIDSFDTFQVNYHADTKTYYIAEDSGCSCPIPFDDFNELSDYDGPHTAAEVVAKLREVKVGTMRYRPDDAQRTESEKARDASLLDCQRASADRVIEHAKERGLWPRKFGTREATVTDHCEALSDAVKRKREKVFQSFFAIAREQISATMATLAGGTSKEFDGEPDRHKITTYLHESNIVGSEVIKPPVSRKIGDPIPEETHRPVLDVDLPVWVRESSTPGHYHLIIDKEMPWSDYAAVVRVLGDVGILEEGFVKASIARRGSWIRTPWTRKDEETK